MAHAVIAGAGPAGASLGYLLARRGLGVTLLERQTDFAREFRGEGLMASGVEALRAMGLGAALDALPQTHIEVVEFFRGGRPFVRIRPQDLGPPGREGGGAVDDTVAAPGCGHGRRAEAQEAHQPVVQHARRLTPPPPPPASFGRPGDGGGVAGGRLAVFAVSPSR